ncbi:YmaF family protein [Brevibacillus laterosporus]|uniref:YmaF family protein n=1 Tax=Brevibacillus laterosporus TaxID=1465 RepID=UPI00264D23C5|nr:YmaF family protein [Brevibacillus laterosporus]MDN9011466.1 YmaF family protein [Brevibacillus laterosporus]MDO0942901.1 YmaF family protein [Brevibacillus laterosporus]
MRKIPVKGFLFQSSESSAEHSHGFYITSWNGMPVHRHPFSGTTSFNDGHDHQYIGVTEPAPTGVPHVHRYYTITSFDDGHSHVIEGTTGPAIQLRRGGHIHYFEGYTTVNGRRPHTHHYKGATENEIP